MWIHIIRDVPEREGHFYEVSEDYPKVINNNKTIKEVSNEVENLIGARAFFIGRWQPFHKGHDYIIRQSLDKGIPVLIGVRDMWEDKNNPFNAYKIKQDIENKYIDEDVEVIVLPNIRSVNIGRKVGYDIIKVEAPKEIEDISATKIRNGISH